MEKNINIYKSHDEKGPKNICKILIVTFVQL